MTHRTQAWQMLGEPGLTLQPPPLRGSRDASSGTGRQPARAVRSPPDAPRPVPCSGNATGPAARSPPGPRGVRAWRRGSSLLFSDAVWSLCALASLHSSSLLCFCVLWPLQHVLRARPRSLLHSGSSLKPLELCQLLCCQLPCLAAVRWLLLSSSVTSEPHSSPPSQQKCRLQPALHSSIPCSSTVRRIAAAGASLVARGWLRWLTTTTGSGRLFSPPQFCTAATTTGASRCRDGSAKNASIRLPMSAVLRRSGSLQEKRHKRIHPAVPTQSHTHTHAHPLLSGLHATTQHYS